MEKAFSSWIEIILSHAWNPFFLKTIPMTTPVSLGSNAKGSFGGLPSLHPNPSLAPPRRKLVTAF